jgi:hypothetical protein
MTAEERWHRVAWAMLVVAGIFVLELILQLKERDLDGVLMSLIPIGVALVGWRLAVWRRDKLAE